MRKRFSMAVMFAELFSTALLSSLAHGSVSLTGFTETPMNFTATYSFENDERPAPSIINKAGLFWKGLMIETFTPANVVAPASYTLTWITGNIRAPHPGESPVGSPWAGYCTFYETPGTTQYCNQSAALPHPIAQDGTLHRDAFNLMMNRNPGGGGTLTVTGTHVSVSAIPLPSAAWLFGSGLLCVAGFALKRRTAIGLATPT